MCSIVIKRTRPSGPEKPHKDTTICANPRSEARLFAPSSGHLRNLRPHLAGNIPSTEITETVLRRFQAVFVRIGTAVQETLFLVRIDDTDGLQISIYYGRTDKLHSPASQVFRNGIR